MGEYQSNFNKFAFSIEINPLEAETVDIHVSRYFIIYI